MNASVATHTEDPDADSAAPLEAITVSRDVQEFDLLIEDMEAELGERWGDLTFAEAGDFLAQPEARSLRHLILAVDGQDEGALPAIVAVAKTAKRRGLSVVLVADGLSPLVMHELLRAGVDDFAPYPLPANALRDALDRAAAPKAPPPIPGGTRRAANDDGPAEAKPEAPPARAAVDGGGGGGTGARAAKVHAFQGVAGGVGTTTIAVNVAMEAAFQRKSDGPSVCILDLNLQYGAVATYLDLARRDAVYELLSDTASMDEPAFRQALQTVRDRVHVLTAPKEMLPLELIGPEDVAALIGLARDCFDVVVVDVPSTLTQWTDTVLMEADHFHLVATAEVRCAQNALRYIELMDAEGIEKGSIRWVLNKAPRGMDLSGKARVKSMTESLGIAFDATLCHGGRAVTDANDQAVPLMKAMARAPLRKEIAAFASALTKDVPAAQAKGMSFLGLRFG